jgi:hypothetical protein
MQLHGIKPTPKEKGFFPKSAINPQQTIPPCNFMGLMESGVYLAEEWVIHFVKPPTPHATSWD